MEFKDKIQKLLMQKNQATQQAIIQENVLHSARQAVSEIQGRINQLQELLIEEDGKNKKRSRTSPNRRMGSK